MDEKKIEQATEQVVVVMASPELLKQMEGRWSPLVQVLVERDASSLTGWSMQIRNPFPPQSQASILLGGPSDDR